MRPPEDNRTKLGWSRVAIFGYFFILGVATATWSARLPAIKESLRLSDGRLGLALFAVPAGAVLTLALSGRIADRFGAVRVLRVAGVLNPAALIPIGLARNLAALMATLAVYGAVAGLLDVSMNACGARLELGYGRPIMSSLHAGYSIAGLAGAGIGGISAWLGISPLPTFVAAAAALIGLGLLAGPRVVIPAARAAPEDPDDPPRRTLRQISLVIWVLGLVALCGQVGEGSAGDWSAVYRTSTWAPRPASRPRRWPRSRSRWRPDGWPATGWPAGSARCGWCGPAAWWPGSGWRPAC